MPIRKATTAGTRGLICFYSESGGGKTYSSLLLARGMAGPTGKIVMIDTENRRGEIYADDAKIGGYDTLPLDEPFSPAAYMAAIQEAEEYGADVIVIDSGSHEWDGIGGVLDMAVIAAGGGQPSFGHWNKPKAAHKKLLQRMLRSSAHIIVCLRAQYKARQVDKKDYARFNISSSKNSEIIRDDFQSPIQDEKFIFEMTVHLYFSNKNPGVPIITKCPDMLLDAFEPDKMISVATGVRVAKFYEAGAPTNKATAELIKAARQAAAKGLDAYQTYFAALQPEQRRELAVLGEHDALKERLAEPAQARDRQQDPPAEPADDGRPDEGDDDPRDQGSYVPPSFPGGADDGEF